MTATLENILETGTVLNDKWVILELIGGSSVSGSEMRSFRYPWEGFPDVGFRCALSIDRGDQ
jgi:hypothetical protein